MTLAGLVATLGAGWTLDDRWNQQANVAAQATQHATDVMTASEGLKESVRAVWLLKRDILNRELVWLRVQGASRALSTLERARIIQLEAEMAEINQQYGGG
jgi:hypothetical protein